ncbi:MAG: hypothetical protein GC168_10580 [Candidatus Hydrogenedens sp.]|nr:hypothetical protein [Candidatus Hydrogenedens sp.]
MKKSEREKQWMAYLDGQLTAGEAAAFDASLSEEERRCLVAEMQLEEGIGERLRDDVSCPDALWDALRKEMNATPRARRWPMFTGMAAAAALALIAGGALLYRSAEVAAPLQEVASAVPTQTIAEDIRTTLEMAGATLVPAQQQTVEEFLEAHDIRLAVNNEPRSLTMSGHKAKLLGACMGNCPRGSIVELLIDYDGKPAKLLLAKNNCSGARIIEGAQERGEVVQVRHMDDYIAGLVVCRRIAKENADQVAMLFDFIRPLTERVAAQELLPARRDSISMQPPGAREAPRRLSTQRMEKSFV